MADRYYEDDNYHDRINYYRIFPYLLYFILAIETHERITDFGENYSRELLFWALMILFTASIAKKNFLLRDVEFLNQRSFRVCMHMVQGYIWSFFVYFCARILFDVQIKLWHQVFYSISTFFSAIGDFIYDALHTSVPVFLITTMLLLFVLPYFIQILILFIIGAATFHAGIVAPALIKGTTLFFTRAYRLFSLTGPLEYEPDYNQE